MCTIYTIMIYKGVHSRIRLFSTSALLPRVKGALSRNGPARQVDPRSLPALLGLLLIILAYPGLLLLEANGDAGLRHLEEIHATPRPEVGLLASPWAPVHPCLGHVHARGVVDVDPFPMTEVLDRLGFGLARPELPVDLAEAHAALDDGLVPGEVELVEDLAGKLLLGELHLRPGLLQRLAADLVGQVDELLGGRGQPRGLAQGLPLGAPDALGARLPAPGVQLPRQLPHDHPPLPAHGPQRVRVDGVPHVVADQARAHEALARARLVLAPAGPVYGAVVPGASTAVGGGLELVVEDGGRLEARRGHALAHLLLHGPPVCRLGHVAEGGLVQVRRFLVALVAVAGLGGGVAGLLLLLLLLAEEEDGDGGAGLRGEGWAEGLEDRRSGPEDPPRWEV